MNAKDIKNSVSEITEAAAAKVGRPNIKTEELASKPVRDQNITTTTEKAIVATFEAIGNFYDALKNSSVEATPELALGFEMLENGEDTDAVMEQFNNSWYVKRNKAYKRAYKRGSSSAKKRIKRIRGTNKKNLC